MPSRTHPCWLLAAWRDLARLLTVLVVATSLSSAAWAAETTAFVDVTVIPMDGPERLLEQTVIVAGGTIVAMGDRRVLVPPPDAQIVDGRGRYLMPGLTDMHVHLFNFGPGSDTDTRATLELLSFLATGITTVRNMAGGPTHLSYREAIAEGRMMGPRLFVSSPALEGEPPVWTFTPRLTRVEDVDAAIAGYADARYDAIKVYHTLSAPVYEAIVAAADRRGLDVVGHVPFDVGIGRALTLGQDTIEHLRGYDFDNIPRALLEVEGGRSAERLSSWSRMPESRMHELARQTVSAGAWNTPTFVVNRFLFDADARAAVAQHPRFQLLPQNKQAAVTSSQFDRLFSPAARQAMREAFTHQLRFVNILSQHGAGLLTGTDTEIPYLVPGFTVIDEIGHLAAAGLSMHEALRAATVSPAETLHVGREAGAVSVGKRADLILLNADPLIDSRNLWQLEGVMAAGRWSTRDAIEGRIRELLSRLTPSTPSAPRP